MSGHAEDAEDAEDRERNAQRMREYRRERGLEAAEEPDVLPRPATAVSQGDLYAGCRRGTFKQANVLTCEVAEHKGCALVASGRKGDGDGGRLTAGGIW